MNNPFKNRVENLSMKYRDRLPQLEGGLFLTDGGIETSLIFDDGFDLPHFAAFHLLREDRGREGLRRYYERYVPIALSGNAGFVLESPTWRASKDWGEKLGYTPTEISQVNKAAIELMMELREVHETSTTPIVISGCVGPRGDGYDPGQIMSAQQAETYHADQILSFRGCRRRHGGRDHHDKQQRGDWGYTGRP